MRSLHRLAPAVFLLVLASPALADEDDHPTLTGAVKAFHDTLSPDWHGAAGPARNAAACGHVGQYVGQARAIVDQSPPARANSASWALAAAGLRDASVALGAYCASGHDRNIVAGLTTLHDRFHDLMKAMPK